MFAPKAVKAKLAAVPVLAVCATAALHGTALAQGGNPITTAASQLTCADPPIEHPFLAFGDSRDYTLAPGADFEDRSAPGWQLSRGAAVVDGNEPYKVHGLDDAASLAIPAGGSATSPTMCVDESYPTFRFFARSGERSPTLKVEVVSSTPHGFEASTATTPLRASTSSWSLTDDIQLPTATPAVAPGGRLVAFRFTAKGRSGSWQIDDVYVDPRCH
jgi:hypothetical protein